MRFSEKKSLLPELNEELAHRYPQNFERRVLSSLELEHPARVKSNRTVITGSMLILRMKNRFWSVLDT